MAAPTMHLAKRTNSLAAGLKPGQRAEVADKRGRAPGRMAAAMRCVALCLLALALANPSASASDAVSVGSKRFTESYVLGEIVTQTLQANGVQARHLQGLGNTAILEQALATGTVQVYPEYTGTIVRELLKREDAGAAAASLAQINQWLAPRGLKVAVPLGFNNTYALAMREDQAAEWGITSISDLAAWAGRHRAAAERLRWGLSHEFLVRADGWPALRRAYALPDGPKGGLDHGLAYQALSQRQIDIIDVYSTDAQIGRLKLRVLRDDKAFFPRYDAVLLMHAALDDTALAAALSGRIDEATMIALNAEVEVDGRSFAEVARAFLQRHGGAAAHPAPGSENGAVPAARRSFINRLFERDLPLLLTQHLALVFGSVALAVLVGLPLGLWAHRRPRAADALMAVVGVLQTVPSLALLALLISLLGQIGFVPALLALFVYALLPIVRNTHAGLANLSPGLVPAARALGLRPQQILRAIELPLAAPTVMAGIKTAAVINVGTATVAAFVGAGGLGERIVAGLAVNDTAQMMAGALPAAALALLVQGVFDAWERRLRRLRRLSA